MIVMKWYKNVSFFFVTVVPWGGVRVGRYPEPTIGVDAWGGIGIGSYLPGRDTLDFRCGCDWFPGLHVVVFRVVTASDLWGELNTH